MGVRCQGPRKSRVGTKYFAYALAATTAVYSLSSVSPSYAQSEHQIFKVPSGSLEKSLAIFGQQAGIQIGFRPELTSGKKSGGVSGALSTETALLRLLQGTNLTYRFINKGTVVLSTENEVSSGSTVSPSGTVQLNTITVQGNSDSATGPVNGIIAQRSTSGTRTDTPIIETPQTVNVVGTTQMRQQGVATVGEALRYTPGVVTGTAGGQADRHDSYFVRGEGGFSAEAQYASTLDGMRWRFSDRTSVQFDPWMLERVEVVKGPSSTLFGAGSPGGIVNLVSKRPSFEKQNHVFASIGSYESGGTGFDFTGPVNDQFAYRFIGLGKIEGNGVDYQKGERFLFAPSLTWSPSTDTSVTLYGLYQRDPKAVDAGFAPAYGSVLPIPGYGKVDASFWQGDPDWNEYSRTETAIGTEVVHNFNENWQVTGKLRYGHLESTTKALDYVGMVDPTTMMRTVYLAEHDNDMMNADVFTEGKFDTGPVEHTVVMGIDHQRLTGGHKDGWDRLQYPTIDIFNLERGVTPNAFSTFREFEQPFKQTGLYAQDQIAVGNWRFLGGLRYDRVDASTSTLVTLNGASAYASTSDSALTGRIGAVYLFDNGIAPFVSYSTSFNPQPKFKYDGSMLEPYKGKMWEGGVRYQSSDDTLFLSATAFTGTKDGVGAATPCEFETSRPLDSCFTDGTKAESKGLEIEARAQLVSGLDLIGAVTWQKVRWEEYEGVGEDLHVVAVPDVTAALWLDYKIPEGNLGHGWSLGGGVRYIGSTYATPDNKLNDQPDYGAYYYEYEGKPSKVPAFAVADASIGYDFGALDHKYDGLEARFSVTNLFDKHYVAACNGYGTCSFGKRREITFRLDYTW